MKSDSVLSKIFVGVAIAVIAPIILSRLNAGKPSPSSAPPVETQSVASPNGVASDQMNQIKEKELELRERELAIKQKEMEASFHRQATEYHEDLDLSGSWMGDNQIAYRLTQSKNVVTFGEYLTLWGQTSLTSSGSGLLQGREINGTAAGLLGQQFPFSIHIVDDDDLQLSFVNAMGQPARITLRRSG